MPVESYNTFVANNVDVIQIPMNRTQRVNNDYVKQTYDWIFFTSVNTVKYFDFQKLDRQAKILAIGNQTAKVLKMRGYTVSFQPKEGLSEGVVNEWLEHIKQKQCVFWPHSQQARRIIYDTLTRLGHTVLEQVIYKNEFLEKDQECLKNLLVQTVPDYALFASPSAWTSFYQLVSQIQCLPSDFWIKMKIAAIGPVTAKTIQRDQQQVMVQPEVYDMPHLYASLLAEIMKRS